MKRYDAEEIKKLRAKLGLTQKGLAEKVGVSKRTVESWEIGRRKANGSACMVMEMLSKRK